MQALIIIFKAISLHLTFDLNLDPSPMGKRGIFYKEIDTHFKKQSPQVDFEMSIVLKY